MQSSTISPKRLPERWLDMFCDSSLSTAPSPLSFMTAEVSWSIFSSASRSCHATFLHESRSASACSGVVPGLLQECGVENHEQPASSATIAIEIANRMNNTSFENSALPCRDRPEVATWRAILVATPFHEICAIPDPGDADAAL